MTTRTADHSKSFTSAVPLRLSNETLKSLAEKHGTPLYVYNGDKIGQMYSGLNDFITWPKLKIFYAMKANYNPHILHLLRSRGAYIDTVSLGDVLLALKCGYSPDRLLNTANNITDEEMKAVKKLGVMMNIGELGLLERYAKAFPGSEVCLRFNPEVVGGENEIVQTADGLSKFGILMIDLPRVKEIVSKYRLKVVGLHSHTGSGIAETEKFYQSMHKIASLARMENFPHLRFLDFGGGFKVPYKPEEHRIDYVAFGKEITRLIGTYSRRYGRELELYFEPGKYIVAESGHLVVQVNTIRNNQGTIIVGTDSGFSQLIRPLLYQAYHHIVNLSNNNGKPAIYNPAGNICEGGDFFAKGRTIPEIKIGHYLSIETAGAYCSSMGSVYNIRPMPTEITVLNNRHLIRKTVTADELTDRIMSECR